MSAFDVPQRCRQLRKAATRERWVVGLGALTASLLLAALATPLLDALDISGPNMEIGAGIVLAVYSLVALVTWVDTPAPDALYGGLVPLLFPIVLTPAVGVVVLAVSARNGMLVPTVASSVTTALIALPAVDSTVGRRPLRMLSAAVGVVTGVVMIVDGAFAV